MISYLRNKPLIGLMLAIAAGLVIAHVITKTGDYLFNYNPELLAGLALFAFAYLAIKMRRNIVRWVVAHKRGLTKAALIVLIPYLVGAGIAKFDSFGDAGPAFFATLFLLCGGFLIAKIRERRRNEPWRNNRLTDVPVAPIQPQHPRH